MPSGPRDADLASAIIIDASAPPETAPPLGRTRRDHVSAAVIGGVDGLLVAALPFAVLALVALIAWAGLGTPSDWTAFVRGAAVAWLLGHGVEVRFTVGAAVFPVSVAVLGPAVVTALGAIRAGRRAAATAAPAVAWVAGVVVTAGIGGVLAAFGASAVAAPSLWQGVVAPAALVAGAGAIGIRAARSRATAASSGAPGAGSRGAGVRAGLAGVALLVAVAGVSVALLLAVHLVDVVDLDEQLSAGGGGGLALTVAQLLLLPTFVVWAAAWFTGAGFALGAGSVVGPFGTAVGPLPALPVLGALPVHAGPFAVAAPLLPMLAGLAVGILAARRSPVRALPLGAIAGLAAGIVLAGLALTVSGAAGPGRFAVVGPVPWLTGVLAAVEIGVPAMIGAALVNRSRRRLAADFERYSTGR